MRLDRGAAAGARPTRRRFLGLALGLLAGAVLTAHTPYRQWKIYRRRHLLILTDRDDGRAGQVARAVAGILAEALPSSGARATRAIGPVRVASLIGGGQLDAAVLHEDLAAAMWRGDPGLGLAGPVPVRALARFGEHLLVVREDFAAEHARAVVETVQAGAASLPVPPQVDPEVALAVPWHRAVARG
jgi:hypothetical protein